MADVVFLREILDASTSTVDTYALEIEGGGKIKVREEWKTEDRVVVYPFGRDGLPKYDKIARIEFEGFKKTIQPGFHKTWNFGYGFTRTLSPLVKILEEELGVTEVIVSKATPTSLSGTKLTLNSKQLNAIFAGLSALLREQYQEVQQSARASLHELFPANVTAPTVKYTKGALSAYISRWKLKEATLSPGDMKDVTGLISINKLNVDTAQLLASKELIEEIYIEDVIKEFEEILGRAGKGKIEEEWQVFFNRYNWIFSQLFAAPVMLLEQKAYVGGKSFEDKNGKIADFLYTNSLTKNIAIIEIKSHQADLIKGSSYRGKDVFASHDDLNGAITQVLDQRSTLQKNFLSLGFEGAADIQNIRCVILAGQLKRHSKDQQASLELIRSNSKDVSIYTYDELLERLKGLRDIITGSVKPKASTKKQKASSTSAKKSPKARKPLK